MAFCGSGVVIRVQPVVLIDVGLKIRGVLPAGKISSQNDADEVPLPSSVAASVRFMGRCSS